MASLPVSVAQRAAASKTMERLSSPTTNNKLQSCVNEKCTDLFSSIHQWEAIIKLPVIPHYSDSAVPFDSNKFNSPIEPCDIYSYIGKSFQPGDSRAFIDRLYLNPKVYPPIFQNDDTSLSEGELKTVNDIVAYLKTAAKDSGSSVRKRNSCYKKMKDFCIRFQCDCNHTAPKNNDDTVSLAFTSSLTATGTDWKKQYYRETLHVNNKNGAAKRSGAGRGAPGLPRRRLRNKKKGHKCPQGFTLRVDNIGFYISTNTGDSQHVGHPKFDASFTHSHINSLTQEEKDEEHLSATIAHLRSQRNDALEDQFGIDDGLQNDRRVEDVRSRLAGRFNETARLLQQIGDPELVKEVEEKVFDPFINKLHKVARERTKRKKTSPTDTEDAVSAPKKSQKVTSLSHL